MIRWEVVPCDWNVKSKTLSHTTFPEAGVGAAVASAEPPSCETLMSLEFLRCFLNFIVNEDGKFCGPPDDELAACCDVKCTRVWGWINKWGFEGWVVAVVVVAVGWPAGVTSPSLLSSSSSCEDVFPLELNLKTTPLDPSFSAAVLFEVVPDCALFCRS